jgi:predicted transposase YdaD
MFEIKLQETRVYQEAKFELIPWFLAYGISIEEVAQLLDLSIEQIEQIRLATEQESSTST